VIYLFIKNTFLLCTYTNSVAITKLEILFVKKYVVQLAGFERTHALLSG
jgi:hypothetical protein